MFIASIRVLTLLALAVPPCWRVCCECPMLRAHLQHIITELLRGMAIACAVSANLKEFFISGQLIVIPFIPLFRYFVILHFTDSRFSSSPSFFLQSWTILLHLPFLPTAAKSVPFWLVQRALHGTSNLKITFFICWIVLSAEKKIVNVNEHL